MAKNGWFWKVQRGEASPPPIVQTLRGSFRCLDEEAGTVEGRFEVGEEFTNPAGMVQGGIVAAMLDAAMGHALASLLDEKEFAPTLNMNVSYLAGAKPGAFTAIGSVSRKGGSIAFLEARLESGDGQLLATATSTAKIGRF